VNQRDYGQAHLRRLSLIRALIDVGGLSVATAQDVLRAVDTPELPPAAVFEAAQRAVSQTELYSGEGSSMARERVDALIRAQGWSVSETNPGRTAAANVIDTFVVLGHPELLRLVEDYATGALRVARADLAAVAQQPDLSAMAETVVAGTVLGDALFAALRRIAQEHVTSEQFPISGEQHVGSAPSTQMRKQS
jgi:hypothetical protein